MRIMVLALTTVALLALPLAAAGSDGGPMVMGACTVCHNAKRICLMLGKKDSGGWAHTVKAMVGKGAKLALEDQAVVVEYLSGLAAGSSPVCQ